MIRGASPNDGVSVERRNGRRQRTLFSANIIFHDNYCSIGAHILNLSEAGALVRPIAITACPNKFVLKQRFGSARNCEVAWRKGDLLGLSFLE
jgi:hypothetical protein